MLKMRLNWTRCPDGVELVGAGAKATFRPKTERVAPVSYEVANLEDVLALRLLNTKDDPDRLTEFFGRFGMPTAAGSMKLRDVEALTGTLVGLLLVDGTETAPERAMQLNMCLEDCAATLKPSVDLTPSGGISLSVVPSDLVALMSMELATAAAVGAEPLVCDHCNTVFLVGPLTGRRSHAKYCSDRCRVAAMRARNQEGKGDER